LSIVVAHEIGHQFGLIDNPSDGGLMKQGCKAIGLFFGDKSLGLIRGAINP
jgi:hypothetical protein